METITEIGWARREYADELMAIWEASVRATHHFLKESDIRRLRPRVREALQMTSRLFAVNCDDKIAGFMGVSGDSLDMLFLLPGMRGRKLGRRLLDFAVNELKVRFVDVNEENPAALGFYLHCNFAVYARSERDGQGRPFPILHLTRKILETERLLLRELTPEDFDAVAAMLRNPRVMRAWERTFSDDEIRSWIERQTLGEHLAPGKSAVAAVEKTECFKFPLDLRKVFLIGGNIVGVDHRFGGETRHRGAADMLEASAEFADEGSEMPRENAEILPPRRIVIDHRDPGRPEIKKPVDHRPLADRLGEFAAGNHPEFFGHPQ